MKLKEVIRPELIPRSRNKFGMTKKDKTPIVMLNLGLMKIRLVSASQKGLLL
jgi:hypothetical protein